MGHRADLREGRVFGADFGVGIEITWREVTYRVQTLI